MTAHDMPLVSVVTTSLNTGRYIEQAIRSVKAQSYPNIEHIIVDGGSTDNTMEIIEKYRGTYNLTLLPERDSGPPEAANNGLKLSEGEIQGVVPADDLLVPWAVSSVVSAFQKDPAADIVYGDLLLMPVGGSTASLSFNPPLSRLKRHLGFGPMNMNSIFWRRHVAEELRGFDTSLNVAADYDFCLRAIRRFRFSKIDEALGVFRFRGDNISTRNKGLLKQNRGAINKRHFGGSQVYSIQLLLYEIGWAIYCAGGLMKILTAGAPTEDDTSEWANLRRLSISKSRLFLDFLASPLFYTNAFFGIKMRHGFIDARQLVQKAITSS